MKQRPGIPPKNKPRRKAGLGSRIAARFAGIGLTADLPELRRQAPRLVNFAD